MSKKNPQENLKNVKAAPHATTRKAATRIKTEEAYETVMAEIHNLMKKGEEQLTITERKRLQSLADAAEDYEDLAHPLPTPASLPDIVRLKMYQLHLNQNFTAKLLGVSDAKFSLIMNGKQKPDLQFVKAIHEKLKIDANLILQAI